MNPKKNETPLKAYMGEDTVFNGSLNFDGTVRIDGKFEGQVRTSDTLIIGETGDISAEIEAGTVICKGKIKGTIIASNKVEMHTTSRVTGNVKAPSLYIELGAILDGNCDMSGNESKIVKLVKTQEKETGTAGG